MPTGSGSIRSIYIILKHWISKAGRSNNSADNLYRLGLERLYGYMTYIRTINEYTQYIDMYTYTSTSTVTSSEFSSAPLSELLPQHLS